MAKELPKQIARNLNAENFQGITLNRSFQFERAVNVNEETREVSLTATSENPVLQYFGWEYGWAYLILDHSVSSVRLERINNGGALLWCHDREKQLGGLSNFAIREADKKTEGTAKFRRVGLGAEKFEDVKDGICQTVSAGFCLYHLERAIDIEDIDGYPVYRSMDWEILEVSLETVEADTSVGVNRAMPENTEILNQNSPLVREKETNIMAEEKDEITANKTESQNPILKRTKEFVAYGNEFAEVELARDFALDPTKTLDDLGKAIIAKRAENQKAIPPTSPETFAENNNVQSLARTNYRGGKLKAFKGERGKESAYRAGKFFQAVLFGDELARNFCRENGIQLTRTQTGTQNEYGGFFVPVEIEDAIIDLRVLYGIFRNLANVSVMTSDTKTINRRTGGLIAYPVGAGKRGTKSKAMWDQIELVARKWMVLAKLEDELSEDATISMADSIVSEMAYAFAFAEDDAGFNGDGSSNYHGIVGVVPKLSGLSGTVANIAGLQVASGNQWSEITEADLLGVVGKLPQFARKSGNVSWFCSHTFNATVLQRIALAKGGVTYTEINGEMKEMFLGKPVEIVEVMPAVEANSQIPLLFGNLSQAATLGDRRGMTVKTTDSNDTDFEADITAIKATERFDINVHDVGNASATATDRKAGPIVGLITAAS